MAKAMKKIVTPVGDFNWIFITGKGKQDLNGNDRFSASVYFDEADKAIQAFITEVKQFWEEHKPKGAGKAKSIGVYYEVKKKVDGKLSQVSVTQPIDEDEMEKTGRIIVQAWTGITWPDGTAKIVKTMNAKGNEVSLGSKKIGNGSRGAISGSIDIYENGPNRGVTYYLNALQITKFVEFSDDAGFEAVADEDAWTGDDLNDAGFEPQPENAQVQPKVQL